MWADRILSIPDDLIVPQITLLNSFKASYAGRIDIEEIKVIVSHRDIPELRITGFIWVKRD